MILNDKDIQEFIEIYERVYGFKPSQNEAAKMATNLIALIDIIIKQPK